LLKTFERILENNQEAKKIITHKVFSYPYTIVDQQNYLSRLVEQNRKADFIKIFEICTTRIHAIVIFLALLEMLNEGKICLIAGEGINNFWLTSPNTL
jgi:segregation and condensation protein A